jgi:hypothetical protein
MEKLPSIFRNIMKNFVTLILQIITFLVCLYLALSCAVFSYKNPKANSMSLFREFSDVVHWKTVEKYQ